MSSLTLNFHTSIASIDSKQGGAVWLDHLFLFLGCPDMPVTSTTPFTGGKIHLLRSFEWNVLENTGWWAVQPNSVTPRLGYDAQSCRHNISDYTAIITGKATAHRNGAVAKERFYRTWILFILGMVVRWLRLCFSNLICIYMIEAVLMHK